MAVNVTVLTSAFSSSVSSSYVTASVSPSANAWLIVAAQNYLDGIAPGINVAGLSLGWTNGQAITWPWLSASGESRLSFWYAETGTSPGSGTITISGTDRGDGPTSSGCTWAVLNATGVASIGGTASNDGAGATSGSITLSAAGIDRPLAFFGHNVNEGATPRASWSELSDQFAASPSMGLETQWRSDAAENTASASWATTKDWGGIATLLTASTSPIAPPPFRSRRHHTIGR